NHGLGVRRRGEWLPVGVAESIQGENKMTASYIFDVFASLDGFASYDNADWGPYWGKQGPEFRERRIAQYDEPQRMVFGADTFRLMMQMIGSSKIPSEELDPVNARMRPMPTTVVSSTLEG